MKAVIRVQLLVTPWTEAHQAPLSMDPPGKNTRVGRNSLLQAIFPTEGWNLCLKSPTLSDRLFTTSATWEARLTYSRHLINSGYCGDLLLFCYGY